MCHEYVYKEFEAVSTVIINLRDDAVLTAEVM
jgi:hypothetical protein